MTTAALFDFLPEDTDGESLLFAFLEWAADHDLELYPHQEEAILSLLSGDHVVLATPTGSGKSMVALAGAFAALAQGKRAVYTAPIKALVSEKFFEMAAQLGADNVGMVTGDASVNPDAPVIVCTAEIMANRALRDGADCDVDLVVMDEFHYYADRDRGWAWQVPLLELPSTQFLLMSATLGDTTSLRADIQERTNRDVTLVDQAERPVPLDFEYRETTLLDTIGELLSDGRSPVYVVHFTQKEATARAQSLTSLDVLSKEEKANVKAAIGGFRFDTPIGKDLKRFVESGIGVHHAGLLPKYRLLIEKLAQQGLLKLICGTDTLGVGVNVPIRTVLFTQLCKYDGRRVRVLTVRDFQQIAGRAGRRGFDVAGSVIVQAPEHVVENKKAEAKAVNDAKKKKKLVKKKPPERGYSHWDGDTLTRLSQGTPETLTSSFAVSHAMMLNVLDRPGDGCAAMKRLLTDNHETRKAQRAHIRRSIAVFRSLVEAEIIQTDPVRVNLDLQDDFRLNQPLSLFVVEAIEALDREAPDHYLQVLSLVESILDDPMAVLIAQKDKAKDTLISELKSQGVEYEERMNRLEEITWPKPEADFIEPAFEIFARHHPWVGRERVSPKAVAREMLEFAETFNQFVARYGLKRSEGLVLRYLTDVYKTLRQTVPVEMLTEDLQDVIEWLGAMIRRVDSSLIDEWERMRNPDEIDDAVEPVFELDDITANQRAFAVLVRNEMFRLVTQLASRRTPLLADDIAEYWEEHEWIGIDADARSGTWFTFDRDAQTATQTLSDPDGHHEWVLEADVDLDASRTEERAVVRPARVIRR
ncbi:MAG: superfamily II RNA helicase [Candidatus Aldehydirespiratoraceae bacterium]|jgi:superfamily II RNA helicase